MSVYFTFNYFVSICVCVGECPTVHVWRSEDYLQYVGFRGQAQVARLGLAFYLVNHLSPA